MDFINDRKVDGYLEASLDMTMHGIMLDGSIITCIGCLSNNVERVNTEVECINRIQIVIGYCVICKDCGKIVYRYKKY